MLTPKRLRTVLGALLTVAASSAAAGTTIFTVGTGVGCGYATIQAAVNAAASSPGFNIIAIRNQTYTAQQINVGAQNITFRGGYANCGDPAPTLPSSRIDGIGGAAAPVFNITGNGVKRFERLVITGGDNIFDTGGGIRFDATGGDVVLNRVTLLQNAARDGGGIYFRADTGVAKLIFEEQVNILLNEVTGDGGGIYIQGTEASMLAVGPGITITNNIASDEGGGIFVRNADVVRLSSSGVGSTGTLSENIAFRGGGLAIDDSNGASKVFIYTTNANEPQRITGNEASERGGAFHVAAGDSAFGSGFPTLCVFDSYIAANRGARGSVLHVFTAEGSFTAASSDVIFGSPSRDCNLSGFGAVRCVPFRSGCNVIENNINQTPNGQASVGATIEIDGETTLRLENFIIGNNRGTRLIDARNLSGFTSQSSQPAVLKTNLIARNTMTDDLIRWSFRSGTELEVQSNTIAANSIGGSVIEFVDGPEKLKYNNNLVFEPGNTAITIPFPIANSTNYNWDYNIAHPPIQLPLPFNNVTGQPRFENETINDFRLMVGSQLVDIWAAAATPATDDLDRRPRPVALPIRRQQASDVGAFERQLDDPFLVDGGFGANLAYWGPGAQGEITPGVVWDALDSNSAVNSGSALVNVPSNPTPNRITALRRCFNVPGWGRYRIRAKAFNSAVGQADFAVLNYRVRYNGLGGLCNLGVPDLQGDVLFVGGGGPTPIWRNLAAPLEIDIPQSVYGFLTTIELRLDVIDGDLSAPFDSGHTGVRFDDISIELVSPENLFSNGFEGP